MTEEVIPVEEKDEQPIEGILETPRQRQRVFRDIMELSYWITLTRAHGAIIQTGKDQQGMFYQLTTEDNV